MVDRDDAFAILAKPDSFEELVFPYGGSMAYPAVDMLRHLNDLRGDQIANEYDGLNEDPVADSNDGIDGLNLIERLINIVLRLLRNVKPKANALFLPKSNTTQFLASDAHETTES